MVIPWLYYGYTMVIPWLYHGYTMVIPWLYHGYTMIMAYFQHFTMISPDAWVDLVVFCRRRFQRLHCENDVSGPYYAALGIMRLGRNPAILGRNDG